MRPLRSLLAALATSSVLIAHAEGLVAEHYLAAGVPAVTREWHGMDFPQAAQALQSGAVPLPRLTDPEGAAVLQRLTAVENLARYQDASLPIGARLADYLHVYEGTGAIFNLHLKAIAAQHPASSPEFTQILVLMLRQAALGLDLIKELLPTIPHDDQYAMRMKGLQRFNGGLTSVFQGAEAMLTEKDNGLSHAERLTLLSAMAETLPRTLWAFSPEFRVELRRRLAKDKAAFPEPDVQAQLAQMAHALAG